MPDLNTAAVRTWLAEAEPAAWPPNRNAFEPLELDDEVAAAIEELGRALDEARSPALIRAASGGGWPPSRPVLCSRRSSHGSVPVGCYMF